MKRGAFIHIFWISFINACGCMWCISTVSFPRIGGLLLLNCWAPAAYRVWFRHFVILFMSHLRSHPVPRFWFFCFFFTPNYGQIWVTWRKGWVKVTKCWLPTFGLCSRTIFSGMSPSANASRGHPYESLGNQKFLQKDIAGARTSGEAPVNVKLLMATRRKSSGLLHRIKERREI